MDHWKMRRGTEVELFCWREGQPTSEVLQIVNEALLAFTFISLILNIANGAQDPIVGKGENP